MSIIIWSTLMLVQTSIIATPSANTAIRAEAIGRIDKDRWSPSLEGKASREKSGKYSGHLTPERNVASHRDMQRAMAEMGLSSAITPLRYTYPGCSRVAMSPWGSESGLKKLNGLNETFQCNTFVYDVSRLDFSKPVGSNLSTQSEELMVGGFPAADIQGILKSHPLTWRSSDVEGGYLFLSVEWVGSKETVVVSVTVPSNAASRAKADTQTILTAIVTELGY